MAVEKELLEGLALIAEGKEEGFNILYSHTYKFVYSRAKYVMKNNEEEALELTQETFVQAYKGIHTLEDANHVYAWLGGIVYRQGMKMFRKKKKEKLLFEDAEGVLEQIPDGNEEFHPEETVQAKAIAEIVMGMIDELPELQRAAIVAFYYDNMKIEEIARHFQCSANTIKSRLNYAKKFLKAKVEEYEKQSRCKLCAVSPAVLVMAFRALFATDEFNLPESVANKVYSSVCKTVGLTPTAIAAEAETIAGVSENIAAAGATVVSAEAAAVGADVVGTVASKVGLTFGSKLGLTIAAIITAGAVGVGTMVFQSATDNQEGDTGIPVISTEETFGQVTEDDIETMGTEAEQDSQEEVIELKEALEEQLESSGKLETNVLDIDMVVSGIMVSSYEAVRTESGEDELRELAQGILNEIITSEMTEFLKVKAIHDYIVMNIDYDYDDYLADTIPASSYTAEGAVETSYAVCAGYAKLFKLLCTHAGIECEYVVGMARTELHAWNQVKVDGEWYNIDVTWDDPVSLEKEFDDHIQNDYEYFLLSDEDMYKNHKAYNAKHECTATSIGNNAFDYFCPWLENNPSVPFIRSDEALETYILRMLEEDNRSFELITMKKVYSKDVISEKIKEFTIKAGYNWHTISRSGGIGIASNYLTKWSFVMYKAPEKFEMFTTEEDVKDFIRTYAEADVEEWTTVYPYEEIHFYSAINTVDEEETEKWALLNGVEVSYHCGEEIIDGYYYGLIFISCFGFDVLDSTEEIRANIQTAYDNGKEEYVFLYDYRNTGMNANEAIGAIIGATPEGITSGHSVMNETYDGLVLFRQYFRK